MTKRHGIRLSGVGIALLAAVLASCSSADPGGRLEGTEATGTVTSALTSSPQISTFALYAARSLALGASDTVTGGDVGVRSSASFSGAQLTVGGSASVDTRFTVFSPTVQVGSLAKVGTVETNSLQNQGGSTGTVGSFPASNMPSLPVPTGPAPGGSSVTVPAFTITTLNPGAYGAANVVGTLILTPGAYSFTSMTLANLGHVWAEPGGVRVAVRDSLTTGTSATIVAVFGQTAGDLTISVAGNDTSTPAVSIGASSQIIGLLVAPHGTISLGASVTVQGALSAFDITASHNVGFTFQDGFLPTAPGQQGQQLVQGYVPPTAGATLVGPLPQSTVVNLAIGLPLQNPAAALTFLQNVTDPKSASFRAYLTPAQFAAQYGPTIASYSALTSFAQAQGLTVKTTYANNLMLDVSGTAAQIDQAFHVNLSTYLRTDGTTFYAPDRAPSLNLTTAITGIEGIDNKNLAKPATATGPGATFSASDLRRAYAPCTSLTGTTQSVGVFSAGSFLASDITAYEGTSFANYPVALGTTPNVSVVPRLVGSYTGPTSDAQFETTMDIEMVLALAPKLHEIDVFEADPKSPSYAGDILSQMALPTYNYIRQFTTSFGISIDSSTVTPLMSLNMMGQALFVSSGDFGAFAPLASGTTPSGTAPFYTEVGGTLLSLGGNSYASETGWSGSGGGIPGFGIASYQSSLLASEPTPFANGASSTFQNQPDVSMVAANVAVQFNGSATSGGGTSSATPLWASFVALANDELSSVSGGTKTIGPMNPALYGIAQTLYGSCFHDITTGNTGNPSNPAGYSAGPGYDLVTGLGSPQCELIYQLGSATPTTPVCPSGQGMCGGACQSFQTDANNCGSCGHTCSPGTCSAGVCKPWQVASQLEITTFATDGNYVAWSGQGATGPFGLFDAPVAGAAGGFAPQLLTQNVQSPMTVGNGEVAWVTYNGTSTSLSYVTEGSTTVTNVPGSLYSGGGGALSMQFSRSGSFYLADTRGSSSSVSVYQCSASASSGSCFVDATVNSASGPTAFSIGNGFISRDGFVIGAGSTVQEANLLNGTAGTASSPGVTQLSVAADTQNIYWVTVNAFTGNNTPASVSVFEAPVSNPSAVTTLVSNLGVGTIFVPGALVASDENNMYFAAVSAAQTSTGPSTITSYPKSGAPPVQIYTTPNFVTDVVAVNGRLYWVETFNNDVNPNASIWGMRYP
jgi:hypothetical protein